MVSYVNVLVVRCFLNSASVLPKIVQLNETEK